MSHEPEFEKFWAIWPRNGGRYSRKGGKTACHKVWDRNYNFTQVETILAHIAYLKTTEAWLKDQGAYIPAPLVYLNQQRWDGADIPEPAESSAVRSTNRLLQEQAEQASRALSSEEVKRRVAGIKEKLRK